MIRHRLITRVALVAGIILVLYGAGWFVVAHVLKSAITDWAADRRADGWTVEHGAITLGGFPLSWRAAIDTPRLARTRHNRAYSWAGPSIELNWKPWTPRTVYYATSGTHKLGGLSAAATNLSETTLTLAQGQGHLIFGPGGHLDKLAIVLDGVRASLPDLEPLKVNRFQALIDNAPPRDGSKPNQPHLIPTFQLDSEVFGLTLPAGQSAPLGRTIGRLALRGTLLGRIAPGRLQDTLSGWQKDGGTVEVDHLTLGWGPLVIQSEGTVALDAALQPTGAMTGTIIGYGETLDALAAGNLIRPNIAMIGKFALGALARAPAGGGRPEIEVPVTVQKNWLYVGPIKLLQMPTIRWN